MLFGGGGHIRAAGCLMPFSLDVAKEKMIDVNRLKTERTDGSDRIFHRTRRILLSFSAKMPPPSEREDVNGKITNAIHYIKRR